MIKSTPWNQAPASCPMIPSQRCQPRNHACRDSAGTPIFLSEKPAPGHGHGVPWCPMRFHVGSHHVNVPICAKRLVWSWRWCLRTSKGIFQVGNNKESDVALRTLVKDFGEVTRHTASRDNYCWSMMPVLRPIAPTWFSPLKSPLRRRLQTLKPDRAWFKERPCPPKARISENCTWHIREASLMEV